MLEFLFATFIDTGNAIASTWIAVFILWTALLSLSRMLTRFRKAKIQNRKFRGAILRHELKWSALNIGITSFVLTQFSTLLVNHSLLTTDPAPIPWYVVLFEFALYFIVFDLYFYVVHRLIHIEPLYSWIHRTHHISTSPNPLSSSSMNPIEGIAEGLIVPIFLTLFSVHEASAFFIIPFASIMGLYVHCGFEFLPKWWYRNPATSWFITPMFHDQHHQYFTCNYGAYTTIWDRIFNTVRPQFLQDFDELKSRSSTTLAAAQNTR